MPAWMEEFSRQFNLSFVVDDRWRYLVNGLASTLQITAGALLIGVVIGIVVAMVRASYDKNHQEMVMGPSKVALWVANALCKVYLTIIRGTPVVVQLLISFFIIFAASRNGIAVAIVTFGINSGAYVAEIFRSGIMSVDLGQMEAGRSLGLNYTQTMRFIIIPQAFKTVLPSLANEFIVLLKETAVAGYVAVTDLTKAGDIIRGNTFLPFMPLIAVACIYLVLVMFFTWLVGKLERRLRNSEH